MSLRTTVIALASMLALTTACTNKKVNNPLAKVDSKQPDKESLSLTPEQWRSLLSGIKSGQYRHLSR